MDSITLTMSEVALLLLMAASKDPEDWTSNAGKALIYKAKSAVRTERSNGLAYHTLIPTSLQVVR